VTCDKSSKSADLLLEKCQLTKRLLDAEEAEGATEIERQIAQLNGQHAEDGRRISALEEQNAELQRRTSATQAVVDPEVEAQHKAHGYLIDCVTAMATLDYSTRLRIVKHIIDDRSVPSWKTIVFEELLGHPRRPSNEPKIASEPTEEFVPDTRSAEEKLREAKAWARSRGL
jgi:hypothetical protein